MLSSKGGAARLVHFFCNYTTVTFAFNGFMFIANATFNNLGKPNYSALLNWGKATLGTIPFVMIGPDYSGACGILVGSGTGGILFSIVALWLSVRLVNSLTEQAVVREKIITTGLPLNLMRFRFPAP